jgi:hypothetical protein
MIPVTQPSHGHDFAFFHRRLRQRLLAAIQAYQENQLPQSLV